CRPTRRTSDHVDQQLRTRRFSGRDFCTERAAGCPLPLSRRDQQSSWERERRAVTAWTRKSPRRHAHTQTSDSNLAYPLTLTIVESISAKDDTPNRDIEIGRASCRE